MVGLWASMRRTMTSGEDVWVVQLNELLKHVEHFRRENIMGYEGKELDSFDAVE